MKKPLQATIATLFALSNIVVLKSTLAQNMEGVSPSTTSNSTTTITPTNTTNTSSSTTSATPSSRNIYQCVNYQNKPTTIVDTPRGRIKLIVWESNYFNNSGWTPEKRCQAVSARFQKFSDDKTLKYVSTGLVKNKYKVICVSSRLPGRGYDCNKDGLLMTLQPNDNPNQVLNDLFVNAAKIGGTAVLRGQTAVSIDTILNRAQVIPTSEQINTEENQPASPAREMKSIEQQKEIPTKTICSPPLCN